MRVRIGHVAPFAYSGTDKDATKTRRAWTYRQAQSTKTIEEAKWCRDRVEGEFAVRDGQGAMPRIRVTRLAGSNARHAKEKICPTGPDEEVCSGVH